MGVRGSCNGYSHAEVTRDSHEVTLLPNLTNQPTITTPPIAPKGEERGIEKEPNIQEQRFSEFWRCYPKKTGKGAALKSWLRIKPTIELHEKIIQSIGRQRGTEQWTKSGGQFVPNPATWLNQGRWDDEIPSLGGTENNPNAQVKETWGWENGR